VARHCSATFSLDKNRIKNGLLAKFNEILPHIRAYNSITVNNKVFGPTKYLAERGGGVQQRLWIFGVFDNKVYGF